MLWIHDNLLNNSTLSKFLSHLHWFCVNTFTCKMLSQRNGKSPLESLKGLKSQENGNLTTGTGLYLACTDVQMFILNKLPLGLNTLV